MKKVLIVGTGTIGKPLIRLLLETREVLGISEVIFHKNEAELKCRGMLVDFLNRGAKLAVYKEKRPAFIQLLADYGFTPSYSFEEAIERADVVIDCTMKGVARKLKDGFYSHLLSPGKGFIAQGSEAGFGKPYAFGINDAALDQDSDRFIQVVSCNTHQILSLLKTLALDSKNSGFKDWKNLRAAKFHLLRRAGDISQDESTIGIEVGKPSHPLYGSHQAEDAVKVLNTLRDSKGQLELSQIHSAADIGNNPFMHVIYFSIVLKETVDLKEVEKRFRENPLTAVTYQMTNNQVFSEGRDRGDSGRILNQTVVCLPSLEVLGGNEVVGRCFTPQDGNALLSSVAAMLWLFDPATYREKIGKIFFKPPYLFGEV